MNGSYQSGPWTKAFALGILLRPILIVPMAPSGPLGGSSLLPIALVAVFAANALFAAVVYVGVRPMLAFGIFTAVFGVILALAGGAVLNLLMPWPVLMALYNVLLIPLGLRAWHERGTSIGTGAPDGRG